MYGLTIKVSGTFDTVVDTVIAALKAEGFGVLTEINVAATLQAKLGIEHPAYRILGACNPTLAYQALQQDANIGLLLPCNIVVRQEEGGVVVALLDPAVQLSLAANPALDALGAEVRSRLERVRDAIAAAN
jgi:uncharacterized protein (DUF302 family)